MIFLCVNILFTLINLDLTHETMFILMFFYDQIIERLQEKSVLELIKYCVINHFKYIN